VYCIALCSNAAGFIVSRLFIGFSLATFVACQFWCTSMFNTKVVGTANALAAGWVSAAVFHYCPTHCSHGMHPSSNKSGGHWPQAW
jgi:nitrate/nitrite transporter NarK